ncbi:erythrose-4-phosphate dehydrogenase [Alcaligenaceae bacterium]|nr:erythrose-4-phosphate dehydrogenase [Alcaligenaceae bacterium]
MNRPIRIGINGYGRIGRCLVRALYESPLKDRFQLVGINEPSDLSTMAYLTKFDSTHGIFPGDVQEGENCLIINGETVHVDHTTDPEEIDWDHWQLDMLLECSGKYSHRHELERFTAQACPKVLVSHPASSAQDVDRTIVYGINQDELTGQEILVSNASCTTNAVVPILALLNQEYGIEHAFLTTLHSVMNDQPLIDGYHHSDLRRTRSAMQSIVPVATGLAQGIERLLPELTRKVQAKAIRVPIVNVSAIDLMLTLKQDVDTKGLNTFLRLAASQRPGLLAYSDNPHASIDFNHNSHSAIIDGSQTHTNSGGFVNVFIWFDNEWGFANRMLDVAAAWGEKFLSDQ